jgi:hypothetical protein
MADKSFGVKQINLIGASGTPTIESPNNLNLNAITVAISTDVTIGGQVQSDLKIGSSYSVGVGTTNPTAKLDVNGTVALGSSVYDANGTFGTNGQVLSNVTGFGVSWTDASGGGGGSVAGSDGQIQYNNGGSFGGASQLYYDDANNRVGINTSTPTAKLDVVGDVKVLGVVTATDFNSTSDVKLKVNIQPIEDPLSKVLKIQGVSFNWIKDNKPSMGVIADEVQKILPELVSDTDPKTVNYNGLIGLLIEVVKEQDIKIKSLENRISKLE